MVLGGWMDGWVGGWVVEPGSGLLTAIKNLQFLRETLGGLGGLVGGWMDGREQKRVKGLLKAIKTIKLQFQRPHYWSFLDSFL